MDGNEILLVYDKECPACNNYCQMVRIRKSVGELKLVDAREPSEIMDEITAAGLDIDQGIVLKMGDVIYYASDAIHAGSKGFYRIGLMDDWQDKVFLVGPSNYGLADPLQNTAVSLLQISVCLLSTEPDFDGIIQMQIMNYYVSEIGPISVKLQKQIDKDEKK